MYIASDPMFSEMMKHMEIGYHFVQDEVAVGLVSGFLHHSFFSQVNRPTF